MENLYVAAMTTKGSNLDNEQPQNISVFILAKSDSSTDFHVTKISDVVATSESTDVTIVDEVIQDIINDPGNEHEKNLDILKEQLNMISIEAVRQIAKSILENHLIFFDGDDIPTITEFLECFCTQKMFLYGTLNSENLKFDIVDDTKINLRQEMLHKKTVLN